MRSGLREMIIAGCLVNPSDDFERRASFRQACRRFIYTENLLPEVQVPTSDEGTALKALQPPSSAVPLLTKAIAEMETEDGWVNLGAVGQRLANIASDFDPRSYGYRKLSDLVRKTRAFEIDQREGRSMRIRAKPTQTPRTHARAKTGATDNAAELP